MDWMQILQISAQILALAFMLFGLLGLIVPIFPGLIVIWVVALIYMIALAVVGSMSVWGWVAFALMTVLMIIGSIADNFVIAKKVREYGTAWSSILLGVLAGLIGSVFLTPIVGLLVTPLGLFAAEYYRLRDRDKAFASSKAWLIGFGWAFALRFSIGVVMIVLWATWVF